MDLPKKFCDEMKRILGENTGVPGIYGRYRKYGLRVNTAKISVEDFLKISLELTPIPYVDNGFYYDPEVAPAKHPLLFCRVVLSSGSQCHDTGLPAGRRGMWCWICVPHREKGHGIGGKTPWNRSFDCQ